MNSKNHIKVTIICFFLICSCSITAPINYYSYTTRELNDFGVVYEEAGNLREAEKCYKEAIKKDPENYIAATNLGNIYFKRKIYTSAQNEYERVIRKYPNYLPALNNLANLYISQKVCDKAELYLKKSLPVIKSKQERRTVYQSMVNLYDLCDRRADSELWKSELRKIDSKVVLENVTFFQQETNQCGPAALASVYNYLGVRQTPSDIAMRIFDIDNQGTLNLQLLIDAREQGLHADMYSGSFEDIKVNIDGGFPLILMFYSGLEKYHYVVVVGYEGENLSSIILHDGKNAFSALERTKANALWKSTGFFTVSIKRP